MFGSEYYTLVAGLREYTLDADTKGFDSREIIDEICAELSASDRRAARLLYLYYDCENIIARRDERGSYNPLGNVAEDLVATLVTTGDGLPQPMQRVLRAYADPESEEAEDTDTSVDFARALWTAYYAVCAESRSHFIREWSAFDRNVRNIAAAVLARRAQRPIAEVVIGAGEVADALRTSSAADFGLRGEAEYVDAVIAAVGDEENLLDKEHRIDAIRWREADELTVFDYFNIDRVLAYLVKINIVARWVRLDAKRGKEALERLLAELNKEDLLKKQ